MNINERDRQKWNGCRLRIRALCNCDYACIRPIEQMKDINRWPASALSVLKANNLSSSSFLFSQGSKFFSALRVHICGTFCDSAVLFLVISFWWAYTAISFRPFFSFKCLCCKSKESKESVPTVHVLIQESCSSVVERVIARCYSDN